MSLNRWFFERENEGRKTKIGRKDVKKYSFSIWEVGTSDRILEVL